MFCRVLEILYMFSQNIGSVVFVPQPDIVALPVGSVSCTGKLITATQSFRSREFSSFIKPMSYSGLSLQNYMFIDQLYLDFLLLGRQILKDIDGLLKTYNMETEITEKPTFSY